MTKNHSISKTLKRFRSFRYILVLEGVAVGALSGLVVVLFRLVLERADGLLQGALQYGREHTWFIPLWFCILAAVSYLVYRLVKWEPMISGSGIPQVEGEMEGELSQNWWKVLVA